ANLSPRVRELAKKITREHPNVYEKTIAVQKYLRKNYTYTLNLKHKPPLEPIDEFLFVTRRGHCEYFASAMAILLRAIGIHTRNVNGFAGGEWNSYGQFYVVRQGHAHAWTEVLFSNLGWISFDPTPATSIEQKETTPGALATIREFFETLHLRWFRYVVQYDLQMQLNMVQKFRKLFHSDPLQNHANKIAQYKWPLIVAGACIIGLLVIFLRRKKQPKTWSNWQNKTTRTTHPATKIYKKALVVLAQFGQTKAQSSTPLEFAKHLRATNFVAANLVEEITRYYYEARFKNDHQGDTSKLDYLAKKLQHTLHQTTR
ncbi:MAG: transglutaminase domain-containing protein, partial [Pseudomonadota bacterium]